MMQCRITGNYNAQMQRGKGGRTDSERRIPIRQDAPGEIGVNWRRSPFLHHDIPLVSLRAVALYVRDLPTGAETRHHGRYPAVRH